MSHPVVIPYVCCELFAQTTLVLRKVAPAHYLYLADSWYHTAAFLADSQDARYAAGAARYSLATADFTDTPAVWAEIARDFATLAETHKATDAGRWYAACHAYALAYRPTGRPCQAFAAR